MFSILIGTLAVGTWQTAGADLQPAVTIERSASVSKGQNAEQADAKFDRNGSIAQLPVETFAPLPKPRRISFPTQLNEPISPSLCHNSIGEEPLARPLPARRGGEGQEVCNSTPTETGNTPNSSRESNPIPNVRSQANSPPAGASPSLETQPSRSQQPPFQPQNLPVVPTESLVTPQQYRTSPNITIITPSGYGKSWGNLSVGFGLQARTRYTNLADGVFGIGFGLGDPRTSVGLDVGITISDLDTLEDGTVSLKLHRLLPEDFAIAVGTQNAIEWGFNDSGRSFYGVVTKRFNLQESVERPFSQVYVSAGLGSGQFRSESDIIENISSVGFFSSVALRVAPPVNAIVEWTGQDLTVGFSIIPFRNIPFVITPAVTDITGTAGDGSRFILGVGYLISF